MNIIIFIGAIKYFLFFLIIIVHVHYGIKKTHTHTITIVFKINVLTYYTSVLVVYNILNIDREKTVFEI